MPDTAISSSVAESPFSDSLMTAIRDRFLFVDEDPFVGKRAYFETGGGSLKLRTATEAAAYWSGIADNEGRANDSSEAVRRICNRGRDDLALFFGSQAGTITGGDSGSDLLHRLIRMICLFAQPGPVVGSALEHAASWDPLRFWAAKTGRRRLLVPVDAASGQLTPAAYAATVSPDTRLATIVHTGNVNGLRCDLAAIVAAIKDKAPGCLIVVDGVQHAPHGALDVEGWGVDAYVFSPYKVFARQGKGFAWLSPRMAAVPHEVPSGAPAESWDLGARDPAIHAAMSAVVGYLDWLGGETGNHAERRDRIAAAGRAISAHERSLLHLLLFGDGAVAGLNELPGVRLVGPPSLDGREGLICFRLDGRNSRAVEAALNEKGYRVFSISPGPFSGHMLTALEIEDCIRISVAHYNTAEEVLGLLSALASF